MAAKPGGSTSSQASDLLPLYPIMRHYIHMVVIPAASCLEACQAFLAQAMLLDQGPQPGPACWQLRRTPSRASRRPTSVPFDEADRSHGSHHFEGARSVSRHVSVGQTKEAQQEATPSLAKLRGCPRQRHHGCFKCQARQGWRNPQPRCRGLPPRRRKLADRPSLLPPGPRRPESCTRPTMESKRSPQDGSLRQMLHQH